MSEKCLLDQWRDMAYDRTHLFLIDFHKSTA